MEKNLKKKPPNNTPSYTCQYVVNKNPKKTKKKNKQSPNIYNGKESGKKIHTHTHMNHFAVYQKQHCKATILQLKINKIHQTFIDLSLCARQYSECLVCISSFNPQKPHHCPLIKKKHGVTITAALGEAVVIPIFTFLTTFET